MAKAWTTDEEIWLELNYKHLETAEERDKFCKDFEKKFNVKRSFHAMRLKAWKMGVKFTDVTGLPTLPEVEKTLGLRPKRLARVILANPDKYPCIRQSNRILVPEETFKRLEEDYRVFNQEDLKLTMDVEEVADKLCVSRKSVMTLKTYGVLKYIRHGIKYRFYKDSVDRALYFKDNSDRHWIHEFEKFHQLTPTYYKHLEKTRENIKKRRQESKKSILATA